LTEYETRVADRSANNGATRTSPQPNPKNLRVNPELSFPQRRPEKSSVPARASAAAECPSSTAAVAQPILSDEKTGTWQWKRLSSSAKASKDRA
jgi:hypothetical protein